MPDRLNRNGPTIVEILTDVPGQWNGWRFSASGRHLIGPDGDRITPQRLAGLLWRDAMELRRAGLRSRREAILARAKDGKLSFVQFMEDTFATVRSFRESGAYRIKANPDGSELDV